MAKFGIALEWGSRGRWFESSHSDQTMIIRTTLSRWVMCSDLSFLLKMLFENKGRTKFLPLSFFAAYDSIHKVVSTILIIGNLGDFLASNIAKSI